MSVAITKLKQISRRLKTPPLWEPANGEMMVPTLKWHAAAATAAAGNVEQLSWSITVTKEDSVCWWKYSQSCSSSRCITGEHTARAQTAWPPVYRVVTPKPLLFFQPAFQRTRVCIRYFQLFSHKPAETASWHAWQLSFSERLGLSGSQRSQQWTGSYAKQVINWLISALINSVWGFQMNPTSLCSFNYFCLHKYSAQTLPICCESNQIINSAGGASDGGETLFLESIVSSGSFNRFRATAVLVYCQRFTEELRELGHPRQTWMQMSDMLVWQADQVMLQHNHREAAALSGHATADQPRRNYCRTSATR